MYSEASRPPGARRGHRPAPRPAPLFSSSCPRRNDAAEILVPLARTGQRGMADINLQGIVRSGMKNREAPASRLQLRYVRSWRSSGARHPTSCASGS